MEILEMPHNMLFVHIMQLNAPHLVRMVDTVLLQIHALVLMDGLEHCVEKVCVCNIHQIMFA